MYTSDINMVMDMNPEDRNSWSGDDDDDDMLAFYL
jgi:hypothetical protein